MRIVALSIVLLLTHWQVAFAKLYEEDDFFVRVIDVGQGLCCVAHLPDNINIVYDAGPPGSRSIAIDNITEVITNQGEDPDDSGVRLLVLSHCDADHIGAVQEIFDTFDVAEVLWTGDIRPAQVLDSSGNPRFDSDGNPILTTWGRCNQAIEAGDDVPGYEVTNLLEDQSDMLPGRTWHYGDSPGRLTFLTGHGIPPPEWGVGAKGTSKYNNAISIIMRIEAYGKSVIFGGDAVGRWDDDPNSACRATELEMVSFKPKLLLNSDVLIAPHHGANNACSPKFIKAVTPEEVIFSCANGQSGGHPWAHPRVATVKRLLAAHVALANIRSTDRSDLDEGEKEWEFGHKTDTSEAKSNDDHVDIRIEPNGQMHVDYFDGQQS